MENDPSKVSWRKLNKRIVALAFVCSVIGGGVALAALTLAGILQAGNAQHGQHSGLNGVVDRITTGLFFQCVVVTGLGMLIAYFLFRLPGYRDYSPKELAVTSQVVGCVSIFCCAGALCLPAIVLSMWALVKMIRNRENTNLNDVAGGLLIGLMSVGELWLMLYGILGGGGAR